MEGNDSVVSEVCSFKPNILKNQIARLKKCFTCFLSDDKWDFGDRKYRDLNGKKLFQSVQKATILTLWIDYNKKSNIMRQISRTEFTNLESIFLGDNSILNIQDLSHIKMPNIKKIALNDNLITRVCSLQKCKFFKLEYLSLNGNKIQEYQIFECLTMKNIQCLGLQDQGQKAWTNLASTWSNLNLSWIIKTEIKQSSTIKIYQNLSIKAQTYLIKLKIRKNLKKRIEQVEHISSCQKLDSRAQKAQIE